MFAFNLPQLIVFIFWALRAQKIESVSLSYSQAKVAESEEETKAAENVILQ